VTDFVCMFLQVVLTLFSIVLTDMQGTGVLLYYAELCVFIAGEAYVVLFFEFFNCFLVSVADVRPPSLGL